MKPVAWIKVRELTYMQAVQEHGKNEWRTNLGLKPEPDDEGLYTETQVQELKRSFEQSVTDPENQPSQYGTVLMKDKVVAPTHRVFQEWLNNPLTKALKQSHKNEIGELTRKEWVGMTDEEVAHIADSEWEEAFVRLVEAKLKEKNT